MTCSRTYSVFHECISCHEKSERRYQSWSSVKDLVPSYAAREKITLQHIVNIGK